MCLHLVFEFLLVNKKEIYLCWYLILGLVADVCFRQNMCAVDAVQYVQGSLDKFFPYPPNVYYRRFFGFS